MDLQSEANDASAMMFGESEEKIKRLEESLVTLQNDLRDKNENILTQREEIENLKVEV